MTASRRLAPLPLLLIPSSVQAQSDPTDLTRPTVDGDPVAYPMGPRQAPQDPQVEAGDPALSVTRPPPAGVPSPIQEGERNLPGNAQRLPIFRRTAPV